MAGPLPGYSRIHHVEEAKLALFRQSIEVRRTGGFKLGFPVRPRESTDAVHDEQDHFFTVVAGKSPQKFHSFHVSDSTSG
jgi:hypothetical protein